jgi:peptidoglycan/LPS O-acetylase OafA/YrhL
VTILDNRRGVDVASRTPSRQRLGHIDALRVLGCLSVVAVHTLGGPFPAGNLGSEATTFVLHYSREIFLFVSALVLVRAYAPRAQPSGRLLDPQAFRLRRLRTIGVPYLCWTGLYVALSIVHGVRPASGSFSQQLLALPGYLTYQVLSGNGWYHLYFLLVTLQFALVFPSVLSLLMRMRGRHHWLFSASLLLQLVTLIVYQQFGYPDGWGRAVVGDASLIAYQFWLIAGAIAGLSLERWHAWMLANRRWILVAFPLAAAGLLATYYAEVPYRGPVRSCDPLQPVMLVWSAVALGAFYLAAVWISQRRSQRVQSTVSCLARLSFGIYLVHPLVLDAVLALLRHLGVLAPTPWMAALSFVTTTLVTIPACVAIERTRLSQALIGRPSRRTPSRHTPPRRLVRS